MGGVQRALKFARYLPQFGWNPYVITVKDIHYYARDESLAREVDGIPVLKSGSLDPARLAHILRPSKKDAGGSGGSAPSIRPALSSAMHKMFYPDSKVLWMPFASHRIRSLIKSTQFHAIYSTSPPVTAHRLAARFDFPWVADFRDYWTIGDGIYAPSSRLMRRYQAIMAQITEKAAGIITVSEPIAESIRNAASVENRVKVRVIPNGFDPADFQGVEPFEFKYFTICYLGNLNSKRSPDNLLMVLKKMLKEDSSLKSKIRLLFVGKHFDLKLPPLDPTMREIVQFKDYQSHTSTLSHALGAGALLLLLSDESSPGVMTGKVFEYLGAGKPILAIVPRHVAVHGLLQGMPDCYLARPDSPEEIEAAITRILAEHLDRSAAETAHKDIPDYLRLYTRKYETEQLAQLLDEISAAGSAGGK